MIQGNTLKKLNRKDFLKFIVIGAGLGHLSSGKSKETDKNAIKMKGKSQTLNKSITLNDDESIIGPGKIILQKGAQIHINGKSCSITNIHFVAEGDYKNQSTVLKIDSKAKDITITNCTFEGSRYTILKADKNGESDKSLEFSSPVKGVYFGHNSCLGNFSRHLYLHGLRDIRIEGNTFKDSLRDSIRLRQNVKRTIISNNIFQNIGRISKESSDAIDSFWSGEELIISNNHIEDVATHGLDLKGLSPDANGSSSNVIIQGNIIKNCQYSGINISSGAIIKNKKNFISHYTLANNHISFCNLNKKENNYAAIYLRHGVKQLNIIGNILFNNYGHAILLGNFEESALQSESIIVAQNNISLLSKGQHCVYALAINGLSIYGNIFKGPKGSEYIDLNKKYKKFNSKEVLVENNLEIVVNDNT